MHLKICRSYISRQTFFLNDLIIRIAWSTILGKHITNDKE